MPRFSGRFPEALARIAASRPDRIVHCGDFTTPDVAAAFERIAPFDAVAGNNDGIEIRTRFGRRKVLEFEGRRIGIVHGDGQGPATTVQRARAAFASDAVEAICFGHSHVPLCERQDGLWLLNPGSPTDKRRQPLYSFALIDIDRYRLKLRLVFFGP